MSYARPHWFGKKVAAPASTSDLLDAGTPSATARPRPQAMAASMREDYATSQGESSSKPTQKQ